MKRFTDWHKLHIGKWQNILRVDSYQTLWVSFIKGLLVGYVICALCSCTVTNKTSSHGCDLMKDGQKCLTDHSCCNK